MGGPLSPLRKSTALNKVIAPFIHCDLKWFVASKQNIKAILNLLFKLPQTLLSPGWSLNVCVCAASSQKASVSVRIAAELFTALYIFKPNFIFIMQGNLHHVTLTLLIF